MSCAARSAHERAATASTHAHLRAIVAPTDFKWRETNSMVFKVCLAGATGWAGSELARSIARTADLVLVAAVSRKHAGDTLGEVLREPRLECPVYASAADALVNPCDVFVEYTKPDCAKANILAALERGAHVVVGTSGLTDGDFADIDVAAHERQRGVLACGNFALTVVLLQVVCRKQPHASSSRSGKSLTTRMATRLTHRVARLANLRRG